MRLKSPGGADPEDYSSLPRQLVEFFRKRPSLGCYIPPKLENSRPTQNVSYREIIGDNAEQPPEEPTQTSLEFFLGGDEKFPEEYPFANEDPISRDRADRVAKKVIKAVYFPGGEDGINSIRKAYMTNTRTHPVKINFCIEGKEARKAVFAKKPSSGRILGFFLYNIISGVSPVRFAFNEHILVEEEVSGTPLYLMGEDVEDTRLLPSVAYKDGILRAAVHVDFMALAPDVAFKTNRIVGPGYRTLLFDFDNLFVAETQERYNALLNAYYNKIDLKSEHSTGVLMDEQFSVYRRVMENQKLFSEFVRIAGGMERAGLTLNQIVQRYHGADSLEHYFNQRLETYQAAGEYLRERAKQKPKH